MVFQLIHQHVPRLEEMPSDNVVHISYVVCPLKPRVLLCHWLCLLSLLIYMLFLNSVELIIVLSQMLLIYLALRNNIFKLIRMYLAVHPTSSKIVQGNGITNIHFHFKVGAYSKAASSLFGTLIILLRKPNLFWNDSKCCTLCII